MIERLKKYLELLRHWTGLERAQSFIDTKDVSGVRLLPKVEKG